MKKTDNEAPGYMFRTSGDGLEGVADRIDGTPEYMDREAQMAKSGHKDDSGKIRMELVHADFVEEVAKVLTFGAEKYDAWNWRKGFTWSRVIGAAFRHLYAWVRGEDKDAETGLSHLSHAACCLMFLIVFEKRRVGEDDRYKE